MSELRLEVVTLAPFVVPGALRVIGRALDVDDAFRPTRLDTRDPPRSRVEGAGAGEALAAYEGVLLGGSSSDDPYVHLVLARDEAPRFSASIEMGDRDAAAAAGWDDVRAPQLTPGGLGLAFEREDDFRERPDLPDRLRDLLARLAEATDAWWGSVSFESAMEHQLHSLHVAAGLPGRRAPLPPGANLWERELRRPGWLTYLGPAFVDHFGRDRLAALGVEPVWAANGGVVVRSTATPFAFDPTVRSLTDYACLRQWLDVLGPHVFAHDAQVPGPPGRDVPRMAAHVARTRPPGADPFTRVGAWAMATPSRPGPRPVPTPTPPAPSPAPAVTVRAVAALRALGFLADRAVAARQACEVPFRVEA
jgi:hypothetical protein